jgi:hypothetical protein
MMINGTVYKLEGKLFELVLWLVAVCETSTLFSIYRSCLALFSQLGGQELLQLLAIGLAEEKEVRGCAILTSR